MTTRLVVILWTGVCVFFCLYIKTERRPIKMKIVITRLVIALLVCFALYSCIPTPTPTESPLSTPTEPVSPLPTPTQLVSPLPTPGVSPLPSTGEGQDQFGQQESIIYKEEFAMDTVNLDLVVKMILVLGAMAFLIEALVQLIIGSWLKYVIPGDPLDPDDDAPEKREVVYKLSASLIGALLAVMYGVDLLGVLIAAFDLTATLPTVAPWVGMVLSGLLVGRGSQWFHDLGTTWIGLDGASKVTISE